MGHRSAAFTMTTYGHLLPDDLPDGDILDRFVSGEASMRLSQDRPHEGEPGAVVDLTRARQP
jgi:hypothetical protein